MKLVLVRFGALAVIFALLVVASFAYYLPIQDPYHPANPGWNGCSEIVGMYNTTMLASYDEVVPGKGDSLLAIVGPNVEFTAHDASNIRAFLGAGGTVLLADNFGTGNMLLEALNVGARISGKQVADLDFYTRNPQFPIAFGFSPSPLTANLTAVAFNRPSYLLTGNSTFTILASSSPFSFIDLDQGHPAANETSASYALMAISQVGKGALIIIADPNVFTNDMLGLFDNTALFRNLMKGHSHLIFDIAHLKNAPLTSYRIELKQELNTARDFLFLSRSGVYFQWASLIAIILGFSIEIARRIRRVKGVNQPRRNHA